MFSPRCDIYFDYNLINLKEFTLSFELEDTEAEEFSKIEETPKKISRLLKEAENDEIPVS